MHITGIICEYNPLHNGHVWQIEEIRRRTPDTHIVAIMSGSFCQRGSAAILDKWTRARLAVLAGCDLVLELPFPFACRSAQNFALGGVQLLADLRLGGQLAFGAETDNLRALTMAAKMLDTPSLQAEIHRHIRAGASYAAAVSATIGLMAGIPEHVLRQPNNILALEYLHALQRYKRLQPLLLPRQQAAHHDDTLQAPFASGTAIRQALYCITSPMPSHSRKKSTATKSMSQPTAPATGEPAVPDWATLARVMPAATLTALQEASAAGLPDADRLYPALQLALTCRSDAELESIYGLAGGEGILPRLRTTTHDATSMEEWLARASTRRYPVARLRRLVPYLLLGLRQDTIDDTTILGPAYIHVLAMNRRGQAVLRAAKKHSLNPIVTKFSDVLTSRIRNAELPSLMQPSPPVEQLTLNMLADGFIAGARQQAAMDSLATELRALLLPHRDPHNDFNTSPWVAPKQD